MRRYTKNTAAVRIIIDIICGRCGSIGANRKGSAVQSECFEWDTNFNKHENRNKENKISSNSNDNGIHDIETNEQRTEKLQIFGTIIDENPELYNEIDERIEVAGVIYNAMSTFLCKREIP